MYSPVRTRLISRMASKMKPITRISRPRLISGCRVTNASGPRFACILRRIQIAGKYGPK